LGQDGHDANPGGGKQKGGKKAVMMDNEGESDDADIGAMGDHHHGADHHEEEHVGADAEEKHCAGGGEGAGKSFSATLGLVIHSAADGIALGASATSPKAGLGLVVFLAIFIHKSTYIPTLTSFSTRLSSPSTLRGFLFCT
jgi:zinc transporter ZupT